MRDPQDSPQPARARLRRIVAVAAVSPAVALGGLVAWATPAVAAGPTVTVTPSSGLSNGQTVTVTGAGFTANYANMVVVQCAASATGANGCDTADVKFTKADASGSFTVQLTLRTKFGSTDCTKVDCIVQGHEGFDASSGKTGTSAPLHFGSVAAPTHTRSSAPAPAPPAATNSSTVEATRATGSAGTGGNGGSAALPTGASSGKAAATGAPFLSELAALAGLAVLLIGGAVAYRHRTGTRHR